GAALRAAGDRLAARPKSALTDELRAAAWRHRGELAARLEPEQARRYCAPGKAREAAAAYAERGRATIHGGAGWIRGPHRRRRGPASADDGRQAVSARLRVRTGVAVRTPPPMRDSRWAAVDRRRHLR